jgi:protein involved in temperature-dependent protein secretion
VLAAGPPWDWNTIQALYGDTNVYTQQLRKLEQFVQTKPQDAAGHFVLAYEYMCIGDGDAAALQLTEVTKLQPKDQLSASLLKSMQGASATGTASE